MDFDPRTRMPGLYGLLVGDDEARRERDKALAELQTAMQRRDTRRQHIAERKAIEATCAALKIGA